MFGHKIGDINLLSEIRNVKRNEMDVLIDAAKSEGWNPGLNDAECFYSCDNNGFWVGLDDDERIVSTLSFVNYPDSDFSFVGFYITFPEYRNEGYGHSLWNEVFRRNPNRNAGLDGVPAQVDNYIKSGFKSNNVNHRYCGQDLRSSGDTRCIVDADAIKFEDICIYDRMHFPARRDAFLRSWICNSHRSITYMEGDNIRGLGVIRECYDGYRIGPLFSDNSSIAKDLLSGLVNGLEGNKIYLDIMDNNYEAGTLVQNIGMRPIFSTSRMYTRGCPDVCWNNVFGITSFELG